MDKGAGQLSSIEAECERWLKDRSAPMTEKPRIAAWGLVKAGKSSLLNMLANRVEDEYFKTGVVRATRFNSELEQDAYVLMDTPGLGIKHEDSQQAFEGLDKADVVIFVHAPPGELDQEEIELLLRVKAVLGKGAERRLIMVLTQLDTHQNGKLDTVAQRVNEQLRKYIGIEPTCFQVSNTRYQKGRAENKSTLVEKSGIPDVLRHLAALATEISGQLEVERFNRHQARKAVLIDTLNKEILTERNKVSRLQRPYTEKASAFNQVMAQLKKTFTAQSTEIDALKQKLKSL